MGSDDEIRKETGFVLGYAGKDGLETQIWGGEEVKFKVYSHWGLDVGQNLDVQEGYVIDVYQKKLVILQIPCSEVFPLRIHFRMCTLLEEELRRKHEKIGSSALTELVASLDNGKA